MQRYVYSPPWQDVSIIGIAGSSGSGKTSLAVEIVGALDRPWVAILSMDSFYKPLLPAESEAAFRNEYDFDSPEAVDFDLLVEKLLHIKQGKRTEVPIYSFKEHQRLPKTSPVYSVRVLILEGIFALYDPRVKELLDIKIFAEADADTCLARRILRDVKHRGRDIEGVIKQWFTFVKPNFERYVDPQRKDADIIVPRGIENRVAIDMIVKHIHQLLKANSRKHADELRRLGQQVEADPLSRRILSLDQGPQLQALGTMLEDQHSETEDFIFHFNRIATILVERALSEYAHFVTAEVETPQGNSYTGLSPSGQISAVVILRGGSALETGLKRVIPDCRTGRLLIQSSFRTGEPELHYQLLPSDIRSHDLVLLLDTQMSSGGAALMAVRVLIDHGVDEDHIVFVTYFAGKIGLNRLCKVFPRVHVVVGRIVDDNEDRWVERRYFGC